MADSAEGPNYWLRQASRRRFLRCAVAGGGSLAGLALIACGGNNNSTSKSTAPTATSGSAASAPSAAPPAASRAAGTTAPSGTSAAASPAGPQPVYGGVLNLNTGNAGREYAFDVIVDSTSFSTSFAPFVYNRMVKAVPNADLDQALGITVTGDLAQKWETPDKLTYTFHIHPDARYHNKAPVNGRAPTAEDVVLTYKRQIAEPKNTSKDKLTQTIDGEPVAIDDKTVQFKTKIPFAPFLGGLLANMYYFWVFPKELIADDNLRLTTPIGAGPWMLKSFKTQVAYEFEKHPNYHWPDAQGRKIPYLDGVKMNVLADQSQFVAQFIGGNLDNTTLNYSDLDQVKSQVKGANIVKSSPGVFYFLAPQQRQERGGPWQDVRMRQALSLAVDRDGLLKLFWDGTGKWHGIVEPTLGAWSLDMRNLGDRKKWYAHDPAQSKQLAAAAGYKGDPLRYIYSNNAYGDLFNQFSLFVADNAKQAGLNVQVVTQDYRGEFITPGKSFFGNYDGVWIGTEAAYGDPYYMLYSMLYDPKQNSWNHVGVNDPQANSLIEQLAGEFDTNKRKDIVRQVEELQTDHMYYVPASTGSSSSANQPWLKNYLFAGVAAAAETYPLMWIDKKS